MTRKQRRFQMPRTRLAHLTLLTLATVAGGCGTNRDAVKPDDMSAAQHHAEAARENDAARQHNKDYDPRAAVPSPFRATGAGAAADYPFPIAVYNPTEVNLARAD